MKRVYLDNNVFVDIEMGKLRAEQFLQKQSCTYYFSEAHINELLEAKDNFRVSQEGRLKLISKLCGRNNILTGALEGPELFEKTPEEMYRICDIPFRNRITQNVNSGDDLFLELRRKLDFDNSVFNNVCPRQVLKMIDEKLKYKIGISLHEYLRATEAYGGKPLYHTLFNLIDSANYWGDKKTAHSNVARLFDAAHAYFAQICNLLVTNDKRMREKVKAVYSYLGVGTRVLSVNEFLLG